MIVMLYRRRYVTALLGGFVLLSLAGCGASPDPSAASNSPDRLSVVTAFYPFAFVAERVAGARADVSTLTQPGAEPHDLELTPRQVASVSEADLVVYEQTFQAAVDEAVAQSGADNALDTTTVVPLHQQGSEHDDADSHADPGHDQEEHAKEEAGGEEHADDEHAGEEHEHGGLDPHVWLDPTNVATIAGAVADRLSALDPDHAAEYAANTAKLRAELAALDRDYRTGLSTCQRREFITTHEAFGYLAERYRLTQIGISGLSPDAEPSPARIAEIQRLAQQHDITTIFSETLVSPAVAESIAGDLGLKTDVLDPIEGITEESQGQDYGAVMRANLTALRAANQCR